MQLKAKVVEEKFQAEERKAKQDGNGSKARRMGRICKQYQVITAFLNLDWCGQSGRAILVDDNKLQDALKLHAAGRPIPRADLPDPPGFAPIPISDTPQVLKYCQE